MRRYRATVSVWVNEKTCPTCSEPLTVSGGVSMEYTFSRGRERSNRYTPSASHRADQRCSSPSRPGRSGIASGMTDQSRSAHPTQEVVNILVSEPELHGGWSATTTTPASGGVSGVNSRMIARNPTPARRARIPIVGVLIAVLLGVFAVMSGSAAPSGAGTANYLG